MQNKQIFHCVDKTLRRLMDSPAHFGGKVFVFGGDFKQILPVVALGGKADIINACLKFSYLWPSIRKLHLTDNVRADRQDAQFSNFQRYLDNIGNGRVNEHQNLINIEAGEFNVRIPNPNIDRSLNVQQFTMNFYSNIPRAANNQFNSAILAPRNTNVDLINEKALEIFSPNQEATIYYSSDSLGPDETEDLQLNITTEFLNSCNVSGLPLHMLRLKLGAIVILLRNINPKKGLCNGVRMRVERLEQNFIVVRIISGKFANQTALLSKITLTSSPQDRYPFIIQRHQLPIRLAYAMTINKSQGQTLDQVGLYLEDQVFTHGQLYVALSRVRSIQSIKVYLGPGQENTKNVVYREVL